MSNALVLFAKAPRLGAVKTRLHAVLSQERVRRLYVAFLNDTLAMARRVRRVKRRIIAFTPADGERLLRHSIGRDARGFEFVPQHGHDLGERMRRAFETSFAAGASKTVIIGTDSPTLPARLIEQAFVALARNDLVLGPSMDGGYYLIGLRVPGSGFRVENLVQGVEWSTERVLERTVRAARRTKLRTCLLDPWYDVDDAASLKFLRTHLEAMAASGSREVPQHTWRALRSTRL